MLVALWWILAAPQDPPPAPPVGTQDTMFLEKARVDHKDGRLTIVYHLAGGIGAQIRPLIDQFKSPKGIIFENAPLNLLAVTDEKESAEKIAEILRAALTPDPQVRIDAQVVEVRWTKEFQIGFVGDQNANSALWIKSAGQSSFFTEARLNFTPAAALTSSPFIGSGFKFFHTDGEFGNFGGLIQTFLQRGRAEIKSNPSVWVKTGKEAEIRSGEDVPIPTPTVVHPGGVATTTIGFKPTGVELKVTPHIVSRDYVTLDIFQSVTARSGRDEIVTAPGVGTIFAPTFTTRSLRSTLIARNGEEVVIGGLIRREKTEVRRGLPLLMDIPFLGYLFSRTIEEDFNTEIIFIIRPVVFPSGREIPRSAVPEK
jgi:general secretion pathway protein D